MIRKIWTLSDKDTGRFVAVLDCNEIAGINVPDVHKDGCAIILKSGVTIHCDWTIENRDKNIQYFLDAIKKMP